MRGGGGGRRPLDSYSTCMIVALLLPYISRVTDVCDMSLSLCVTIYLPYFSRALAYASVATVHTYEHVVLYIPSTYLCMPYLTFSVLPLLKKKPFGHVQNV